MNTITYKGGPYNGKTETVKGIHTKVYPAVDSDKGHYELTEAAFVNEKEYKEDEDAEKKFEQTATWRSNTPPAKKK